jgi:hypothetical protein
MSSNAPVRHHHQQQQQQQQPRRPRQKSQQPLTEERRRELVGRVAAELAAHGTAVQTHALLAAMPRIESFFA